MSVRSIGVPPVKAQTPSAWADVTGKPSTFPPAAHSHVIADVTGLQSALDIAAASPAQPNWSSLAGKPATFAPSAHTHTIAEVTGLQAALDSKINGATLLGTITVAETAVLAITAGARRVTVTTPAGYGVAVGQNLLVFPVSVPSGLYATHDVIATGANTISVGISAPLLAVGASYSIQCRLVRINT